MVHEVLEHLLVLGLHHVRMMLQQAVDARHAVHVVLPI